MSYLNFLQILTKLKNNPKSALQMECRSTETTVSMSRTILLTALLTIGCSQISSCNEKGGCACTDNKTNTTERILYLKRNLIKGCKKFCLPMYMRDI